jgi:hypothetical protein
VTVQPQCVLVDDRDLLVLRLTRVPRDPDSGRRKRVVILAAPTLARPELAKRLRQTADLLDDLEWIEARKEAAS